MRWLETLVSYLGKVARDDLPYYTLARIGAELRLTPRSLEEEVAGGRMLLAGETPPNFAKAREEAEALGEEALREAASFAVAVAHRIMDDADDLPPYPSDSRGADEWRATAHRLACARDNLESALVALSLTDTDFRAATRATERLDDVASEVFLDIDIPHSLHLEAAAHIEPDGWWVTPREGAE